ncbi:MAG: SusC/RagA family TonB-linked outer membrane protein [Bacteroidetes bacterium]|nr:MAG: SusC/RagA family TonB-linked outer membrane protein [Bacteroidota bacterium]
MRKLLLLMFLIVSCVGHLWAQRTITGTITSAEDGKPLSGVSVLILGTTKGTLTDFEGKFQLTDVPENARLRITLFGYSQQEVEVGDRTNLNIALETEAADLDEVVITSFGIKRDKKALQYSVTEIEGSDFTEAREVNIANALSGKVAGVNAVNLSSGPAGSSRVIIRGNVSLTGNNQPLYIVDGVPIDNSTFGQAGLWGGSDEGDGTSSINPDDIETISVLKGANAAALYGSRASNGVILITTKSGRSRKGIGIEFNSNFVFEDVINHFDFQDQYGHGRDGLAPADANEAWSFGNSSNWGARFNGQMVPQFDGVSRPYTFQQDENIKRFYQTGSTWTNTLGFSGGNENHNIRLNASILDNKSVLPNAGFKRRNVSMSYNGKFADRVTVTSKVLYSNEDAQNRPRIADSPGNATNALYTLPYSLNVNDLRGDPNKLGAVPEGFVPMDGKAPGEELQISNNLWNANPWWAAYQFENDDVRDRVITSNVVRVDVTDFLYVQGRASMDWYTRRETDITPYGTGYARRGNMQERERRVREINLEAIVGLSKTFGDISVDAFGGYNRMRRSSETLALTGNNFNIPFFHTVSNLANQSIGYDISKEGINSIFGSATIGYKDYLYLTGTARRDWFSTLDPDNNDIFYPSVGGSLVFSELLGLDASGLLTFGKLRASWAQVGGDTDPYRRDLTYRLGQGHLGQPTASIQQSSLPNPFLVPLTSTEFEVGTELAFFNNRMGLDLTFYSQRTTEDILSASISRTSGFNSTTVNVGEMKNQGIELLLRGRPVQTADFSWDVSFNFAYNDNEVVSLAEGLEEIRNSGNLGQPRTRWAFIFNVVGEPFGVIKGFTQEMINGQPVFNPETGQPVQSSEISILGNGVHKYTGGMTNSISWKGLYADILIDFKAGGDIYSGTNVRQVGSGGHRMTVEPVSGLGFVSEGREKITVTGVSPDGEAFTKVLDATETDGFWGAYSQLSDRFIYDASFIKLRHVSVGYTIPRTMMDKLPVNAIRLSFVARNLALLLNHMENVDPESTYNNSNAQGLDYYSFPQTRSYGFNLRIDF